MPSNNPPAPPKKLSEADLIFSRIKVGDIKVIFDLPDNLRDDSEFMLKFFAECIKHLSNDPNSLHHFNSIYQLASPRLQKDPDFALKAVTLQGSFYSELPLELKDDEDIFLTAFKSDYSNQVFQNYNKASNRLQNNVEICQSLMWEYNSIYPNLTKTMKLHPEIIVLALQNPSNFEYLPENFKKQKTNVLKMIERLDGFHEELVQKCIAPEFLKDEEVVLALVANIPNYYHQLQPKQKQNLNIILKTLQTAENKNDVAFDDALFVLAININTLSINITGNRSNADPESYESLILKTQSLIHEQLHQALKADKIGIKTAQPLNFPANATKPKASNRI